METVDWDVFDPEPLFAQLRASTSAPDAEKLVWAFERALAVTHVDEGLLEYVLIAAVCLIARAEQCSPRTVLEKYFRRAVPDEEWRQIYLPLFT